MKNYQAASLFPSLVGFGISWRPVSSHISHCCNPFLCFKNIGATIVAPQTEHGYQIADSNSIKAEKKPMSVQTRERGLPKYNAEGPAAEAVL